MPKVFLHIGMPKAGSASIQLSLDGFDDGRARYAHLGPPCHSSKIMACFVSEPERNTFFRRKTLDAAVIERMRRRSDADLRAEMELGRDTLIISGEAIDMLSGQDVAAMDRYFASHGHDLEVVAYVREPVGFASSAFQQSVKRDKRTFDLPRPRYRNRYEHFIKVLGAERVKLRDFRRESLTDGSVVADFAALVGLDGSRLVEVRANESLSAAAVAHLYFWNRDGGEVAWDMQQNVARNLMTDALARHFSGRFRLSRNLIREIAEPDDLDWIERTAGFPVTGELTRKDADDPDVIGSEADLAAIRDATLPQLAALLDELGIELPGNRNSFQMMRRLERHFSRAARREIRIREARRRPAA